MVDLFLIEFYSKRVVLHFFSNLIYGNRRSLNSMTIIKILQIVAMKYYYDITVKIV